ncbi:hypothetical protein [Streptomyces termitum]|uniref:hypothetical protein n=1 Tax=Streptomyces termitum TaxID=67368 RepID=UPI0033BB6128
MAKTSGDSAGRAVRLTLWAYALATVPLHLWFLHRTARWVPHLPGGLHLHVWLPVAAPLGAAGLALWSATAWWRAGGRPARRAWWPPLFLSAALSLTTGTLGLAGRPTGPAGALAAVVTAFGLGGLWLLPPALSPRLLAALDDRRQRGR